MPGMRPDEPQRVAARFGVSRRRILELLRDADTGLGLEELASGSGLHPNTVRFHLDRLSADGLVQRQPEARSRPGRPRLTFTATPRPDLDPERRNYRFLAQILAGFVASRPDGEKEARGIGQVWGRRMAIRPGPSAASTEGQGVGELLRVLDEVGFAPEHTEDDAGHRIVLRHCPFLEVAEAHQDVACSVHLGLMQGVLAELGAPLVAEELQPFAERAGCLAYARRLP